MNAPSPAAPARRTALAVLGAVLAVTLTACGTGTGSSDPTPAPSASTPAVGPEEPTGSMFTDNGTFSQHTVIDGIDYVLTIYPTERTPYTHEWYPGGDKYFTISMTAYDTDRAPRDPFATKRVVYLDRVSIDSAATNVDGATVGAAPYRLDEQAARITLDPEPLAHPQYGMVITSPKGAFELRDQVIATLDPAVAEVTLTFRATVWAENAPGTGLLNRHDITAEIPIVIFESDQDTTDVTEIP